MPEDIQIVVFVSGGVVQEVRSSRPDVQVTVVDWDRAEEDEERLQDAESQAIQSARLYPVF